MKILALADRHIYDDLIKIIKEENIELVLLLGDLKFIDICDLANANIPILGVYGNHCQSDYLPKLKAKNLHLRDCIVNNINFRGLQGCPFYKGGKNELTQEEAFEIFNNELNTDILISHSPAEGINSSGESPHEGFAALTEYLKVKQPQFFFHGHSYPNLEQKISKFHNTIVYWVSGCEVIDLKELFLNDNYPQAKGY